MSAAVECCVMFDARGYAVGFVDARGNARNTSGFRCSPACDHAIAVNGEWVSELAAEVQALMRPCEGCNAGPGEACRPGCLALVE
jgi:hypothetical protein